MFKVLMTKILLNSNTSKYWWFLLDILKWNKMSLYLFDSVSFVQHSIIFDICVNRFVTVSLIKRWSIYTQYEWIGVFPLFLLKMNRSTLKNASFNQQTGGDPWKTTLSFCDLLLSEDVKMFWLLTNRENYEGKTTFLSTSISILSSLQNDQVTIYQLDVSIDMQYFTCTEGFCKKTNLFVGIRKFMTRRKLSSFNLDCKLAIES